MTAAYWATAAVALLVPTGSRQEIPAFFVAAAAVIHGAEGNDLQVGAVKVKVQTAVQILPRAVDNGLTCVRVSPTSRPGCPRCGTVTAVGINRSQERAPYFQSKVNFCIPNGYAVR